jgi:bacterial/archaeal transporter family-2 protein
MPRNTSPTPRRPYALAVVASIFSGTLVALQARINGEFGVALGDGALAALISFSTGSVVLGLVVLTHKQSRSGVGRVVAGLRSGRVPWWALFGGVGGGFLVLTQGLSAGVLGVALFTIAVITGQSLGALAIDTKGLVGMPKVKLGVWRIAGMLVVVTGVLVALDLDVAGAGGTGWLFVLPLVAGIGTGFQQAINGQVGVVAGSPLSATLINFGVGTLLLTVAFLVSLPFTGGPDAFPDSWWLWMGGIVGATFIAIQVSTVTTIGVLGLGVSLVTGQLLGSILLDAFFPVNDMGVQITTIIGAVITLFGAIVVTIARQKAA